MTAPSGLLPPFIPGSADSSVPYTPPSPPESGAAPTVTVEIAYGDDADVLTPTWIAVGTPLPAGSTRRGRQYELDDVQAGSASLTFDSSDGSLTPDPATDLTVDKQIRVTVTPPVPFDVNAAVIHRGFVTDYALDTMGGFEVAGTSVNSTDNSDGLSLVTLKSDFAMELEGFGPYGYWPCADDATSPVAGEVSGAGRKPLEVKQYYGPAGGGIGGTFKFGADPFTVDDTATGLTLTPLIVSGSTDSGYYLRLPAGLTSAGFTVLFAFRTSAAPTGSMSLFTTADSAGNIVTYTAMDSSYHIETDFFPNSSTTVFSNTAKAYNDGVSHLAAIRLSSTGKTVTTFIDGASVASAVSTVAWSGTVDVATLALASGQGFDGRPFYGDLGHVAVFTGPLTNSQISRLYKAWGGFVGETADQRIDRYLGYGTWPGGRVFDHGKTVLGATPVAGLDVLAAVKAAANTEQGLFFIGPDGSARFHSRRHRLNPTPKAVFDSTLPIDRSGLVFSLDRSFVRNDVTGTRPGGATIRRTDPDSIREHRRRSDTLDLPVLSDDDLESAVSWRIARYKNAATRVGQVVLDPFTTPELWPAALGLEIGDCIRLSDLPPVAPAPSMDFYVEAVAHSFDKRSFKTTLQLSPANNMGYWRLGVPGYSTLGVSTRLGW